VLRPAFRPSPGRRQGPVDSTCPRILDTNPAGPSPDSVATGRVLNITARVHLPSCQCPGSRQLRSNLAAARLDRGSNRPQLPCGDVEWSDSELDPSATC
jgi:hypothetical protein